jgi:hypothetical protein
MTPMEANAKKSCFYILKALILITGLNAGVAMAIEEPEFQIQSKTDQYEIRQYPEILVAETQVKAGFEDAGSVAFRILADYIFGKNKTKIKIDMTSPVTQQQESEKIAMTAPVLQAKQAGGYTIQFTMPKKYTTLESLPDPIDSRVTLKKIPSRTLAVYTYSGSWSEERFQEKLQEFRSALDQNQIQTTGEPVLSRYNSPFMIWFLRRNEIWLELKK